jgi:hypothetical protein
MWGLEPKPLLTPGGRQDLSKILHCDKNLADISHQQLQSVYPKNVALRTVRQITFSMDQRPIALYLSMKGLSATLIYQELVDTLGREVAAYSTVTWYLREARFAGQSEEVPIETELMTPNPVDIAILGALADRPFSSVRELSRLTYLSRTTIHRHLTESLCFAIRYLRWIPHRLSDQQKAIRVNLSRELLRVLEVQQSRDWHDIVTLDESWFYFSTDHERIWLAPGETVPDRERDMIQSPKMMITIEL